MSYIDSHIFGIFAMFSVLIVSILFSLIVALKIDGKDRDNAGAAAMIVCFVICMIFVVCYVAAFNKTKCDVELDIYNYENNTSYYIFERDEKYCYVYAGNGEVLKFNQLEEVEVEK